ncbi:MAG TPA: hypothetical protein VFS20_23380 [Longimicrobium sp.]|nr:hypothetical protein [Longimicrobium sp.]
MNRAMHTLGAVGALSIAVASSVHATTLRAPLERSEGLLAAHASAAPLQQGGGKGNGGGGGQHARGHQGGHQGGGKHGGAARQGGGGGGQRAARSGGGERSKARGGSARRTESVASGRSRNSGGERTFRSNRSTRTDRVERSTNRAATRRAAATASARGSERATRILSGATAIGRRHGLAANAVNVRTENGRVRLLNRRGDLLMDMAADRYDDIGAWRLRRMGYQQVRGNAPAFCRSGDGHPVWGREWCLNKGFGLGSRSGTLWSRGTIDDVIFRRFDYGTRLDRGGLLGVLGDLVLGRLALQALTLGYDQPLMGVWVAEPQSPRLLRVYSGSYPVAEFVDTNYDSRPEILYVVQPL